MDDPGTTKLRNDLVDGLCASGAITSSSVEAALREVPRHVFLPDTPAEQAYADEAIVTKTDDTGVPISSSSQPAMVALMLEQLEPSKGQRVLEIGAGTGFNAALLAHIVGPQGSVTTVDIDGEVADRARTALHRVGFPDVTVECGDGVLGFAPSAPYDRIIVTVGASDLPPAWFEQLDAAGLMVVPLGLRGLQRSVCFELAPAANSPLRARQWRSRSVVDCSFMQMRGASPGARRQIPVADKAMLWLDDDRLVDVEGLGAALAAAVPAADIDAGMSMSTRDVLSGLGLWLALSDGDYCRIHGLPDVVGSAALLREDSLAAPAPVGSGDGTSTATGFPADHTEPFDLGIRGYGRHAESLGRQLYVGMQAWDAAGRPSTADLEIVVHPADTPAETIGAPYVIDKSHVRLGLSFGPRQGSNR